jgi:hypothetical protein
MPAALYNYCRKGEHRPIKLGGGFVLPTDRQSQDYLLCEGCEGVLNKGGEEWIRVKLNARDTHVHARTGYYSE